MTDPTNEPVQEQAPSTGKRAALAPPWRPGQSGNPAGRKPGTSEVAKLRASIAKHIPAIVTKLVALAEAGDTQAARLLLERVLPPVKAIELPAPIDLPGDTLTDQGKAVLQAGSVGTLAPGQVAQLLTALGSLAKLVETDDLARRIAALEQANLTGERT